MQGRAEALALLHMDNAESAQQCSRRHEREADGWAASRGAPAQRGPRQARRRSSTGPRGFGPMENDESKVALLAHIGLPSWCNLVRGCQHVQVGVHRPTQETVIQVEMRLALRGENPAFWLPG